MNIPAIEQYVRKLEKRIEQLEKYVDVTTHGANSITAYRKIFIERDETYGM